MWIVANKQEKSARLTTGLTLVWGGKIDGGTFNILEGAHPLLKREHWGKCQRMKAVSSEILSGTTATSIQQNQENKSGYRKTKDKHKGP